MMNQLQQFLETFRSNQIFAFVAVILFSGIIYLNYFSGMSFQRYFTKSKRTLNYLYLIIVLLNLTWIYLNYDKKALDQQQLSDQKKIASQISDLPEINDQPPMSNSQSSHVLESKTKRNVNNCKKKKVAALQQWKCGICQQLLDETYEVDHIIPLYQGGSNEIDNLMALDPICHKKKTFQQQYL